jgi:hypothetical protein
MELHTDWGARSGLHKVQAVRMQAVRTHRSRTAPRSGALWAGEAVPSGQAERCRCLWTMDLERTSTVTSTCVAAALHAARNQHSSAWHAISTATMREAHSILWPC